ncbi:MAG: radical SAM protein [Acidobacteria bacterium]|nr:radical SAM protein [Acidobacteriota bacterium]
MNKESNPYTVRKRLDEAVLWPDRAPKLGGMDIELTERCNLNCIHCYINQPAGDREIQAGEMDTDRVKTVLKEAADLGCLSVRFTGGEPLIRPDFTELYLFARQLGLRIILFTNATLITPDLAEILARTPPLEKIEITVFGMSPESYRAVTGRPDAYSTTMRGINLLLEKQVPFIVKGVLLPANEKDVPAFESWAATLPWMDEPPDYAMFLDLRARRDSVEKNCGIRQLRYSPEEGMRFLLRRPEYHRTEMIRFCKKFLSGPTDRLFPCGAGKGVCVDAYGRAQLCLTLRHPDTVYDLKNNSLDTMFLKFTPEIRKMVARNPDYLKRCARCFLKGFCEQCPAKSWMEHGTLDTPVEYLCDVTHKQARNIGLLNENERAWDVTDWKARINSLE